MNIYLFLLYAKNSPMLKKLDYRYNKASKKIVSTSLNDRSSATGSDNFVGNFGTNFIRFLYADDLTLVYTGTASSISDVVQPFIPEETRDRLTSWKF